MQKPLDAHLLGVFTSEYLQVPYVSERGGFVLVEDSSDMLVNSYREDKPRTEGVSLPFESVKPETC